MQALGPKADEISAASPGRGELAAVVNDAVEHSVALHIEPFLDEIGMPISDLVNAHAALTARLGEVESEASPVAPPP